MTLSKLVAIASVQRLGVGYDRHHHLRIMSAGKRPEDTQSELKVTVGV